jgi:ABC-type Co2+ transport system permease subunit
MNRIIKEPDLKKAQSKKAIRQRSAWLASMFGCAAFLLMAVKLYKVPVSSMLGNLLTALLVLGIIIAAAAVLVWLKSTIKKWRK